MVSKQSQHISANISPVGPGLAKADRNCRTWREEKAGLEGQSRSRQWGCWVGAVTQFLMLNLLYIMPGFRAKHQHHEESG